MGRMETTNKTVYFILWLGCILGVVALLPYLYYLQVEQPTVSLQTLFLLVLVQTSILSGIALWISFKIIPKTDLDPFSMANPLKNIIIPGVCYGVFVSILLAVLDKGIFSGSSLHNVQAPPFWAGMLASIYGGINEEVLCRVFLLSGLYYILSKTKKNRTMLLWVATVIAALIFGIGHLPAASKLVTLTGFETARILLLNGIPGMIFGWLYWSRSFYTAALAHFTADIFLHGIL
jgi:hypothetical protein